MSMVCGLDLHRQQITFDALVVESGESWRGRVWQPDRERFRRWLRDDVTPRAQGGPVALAVEGCTGWRYVVEEIVAAGFEAHVAEPADTKNARGRKHRAKTDRTDARLIRELLASGDLPESWIPPTDVLEWRERVRLYKSLIDQRTTCQRIHAELFQHGVSVPEGAIRSAATRARLAGEAVQLSPAGRQRIRVGYQMIDATDAEAMPLKRDLQRFGARQPACRALANAHYGIGGLLAVAIWSELGDCRRFSRSRQAVRHTGLDVAVDASDRRRARVDICPGKDRRRCGGRCTKRRRNASHQRSPDHAYYAKVKERHGGKIAAIAVARQFTRRCYHILRDLESDIVYAAPT
jgi:transposase